MKRFDRSNKKKINWMIYTLEEVNMSIVDFSKIVRDADN